MTRLSPVEPTVTTRATWDRKASERINALLQQVEDLQNRVYKLEHP